MRGRIKALIALLLVALTVISLPSCKKSPTFGHAELTIELNERFTEYDSEGVYDASYSYGGIIVGILRLSHEACLQEGIATTLSPLEFAAFYRAKTGGIDSVGDIEEYNDVAYFNYTLTGKDGRLYKYTHTFYTAQFAYFVVTFITLDEDYEELFDDICYYIDTVRLKQV